MARLGRRLIPALMPAILALAVFAPAAGAAPPTPETDPFYKYSGPKPLAQIAPGTVLKTRTFSYRPIGVLAPAKAIQLLYRSTSALGEPTVNVTTVLEPAAALGTPSVIAYGSFYDSLKPADEPSYSLQGGPTAGGRFDQLETAIIGVLLLTGRTVVVADTEGENADFAAGPEYGRNTLDSLRAVLASPATGLAGTKGIGLLGYSGGAIAAEWAAELAPTYAPDINSKLVGAAIGGVLVDPAHNLHYIEGSSSWDGLMMMALIGVSRAFHVDLTPYFSEFGKQLFAKLKAASINAVLGAYSGLTWAQIAKPEYPTPESVPPYVKIVNRLIMGTGGVPTVPFLIDQGAFGELEGTAGNKPGIGEGDGVMVAGDVRSLARQYCAHGLKVQYDQYPLAHLTTALTWLSNSLGWLAGRFAGNAAPQNCGSIEAGNPLTPIAE